MNEEFKWLIDSQLARNKKILEPDQIYKTSDFPDGVAAEWVKTGAASWVTEPDLATAAKVGEKAKPIKEARATKSANLAGEAEQASEKSKKEK